MTIRHDVNGCLEGVFAHGQVYVLVSRVTEPTHFCAIGVPPADLLEDVARAWKKAGFDVDTCFHFAAAVTDDWCYKRAKAGEDPCNNVAARFTTKREGARRVPLRAKTLAQILNPQPETADVLHGLLDWIQRADLAAQRGDPRPDIQRADGAPLFPNSDWWLTELERRNPGTQHEVDEANT